MCSQLSMMGGGGVVYVLSKVLSGEEGVGKFCPGGVGYVLSRREGGRVT